MTDHRQSADEGVLRHAAALFVLQRLLDRRPPGADGSAAVSRPTTTASSRVRPRSTGRSSTSSRCGATSSCSREERRAAVQARGGARGRDRRVRHAPTASRTACSKIRARCTYDPKALVGIRRRLMQRHHRRRRRRHQEDLGRTAAPRRIVPLVRPAARRGLRAQRDRRDAAGGPALRHHARLVPLFSDAGSELGLEDDLTHESYEQFWDQSVEQFSAVFGTDNPDLSAFRDRGGKIDSHGTAGPIR